MSLIAVRIAMSSTPQVTDNAARHQFEAQTDAGLALIRYRIKDNVMDLVHTEVPQALEGGGVGSALARFALDEARARGMKVIPTCPFVSAFIRRHPEYADLVSKQ